MFAQINNREWAYIFIFLILLIFMLYKNIWFWDIIIDCIKLYLIYFLPYTIFFIIIHYLLFKFDIFDFSLLKDSLYLFIAGIVFTGKNLDNINYKSAAINFIFGTFTIIGLIETFVSTYTLSIFEEVVFIILFTIILLLQGILNNDSKYQFEQFNNTKKFINRVFYIAGFIYFYLLINRFMDQPDLFLSLNTITVLAYTLIVSIFMYPIIFAGLLFSDYQQLFINVWTYFKDDWKKTWYCRFKVIQITKISRTKAFIMKPMMHNHIHSRLSINDLNQAFIDMENEIKKLGNNNVHDIKSK